MFRKAPFSMALVMIVVSVAIAANPVGRWQGTIDAGGTPLAVRMALTVTGETLGGTMELPEHGADFPIQGGTVKGDSIHFTVDFAGMATLKARGRVAGDTLHLASDVGAGETTSALARIP
jgi:hypothetical protein